MNSMINGSKLLAAMLCVAMLAGCNAVEDVREEPFTPIPPSPTVLQGTITGLGSKRPVYLDSGVTLAGHEREQSYFGSLAVPEVPFSFGSLPSGIPYNITVRIQPYGMICSVANGSGTTGSGATAPAVTCVDNPAVTRYTISGTVLPAASAIQNLNVILTTEEGVETIPVTGLSAFTFTRGVFNAPVLEPPTYTWSVIARYTDANGVVNNCAVTGGSGSQPAANVTNVSVTACTFPVTGNVQYSAPPGGTAQAIGAGGVRLGLRSLGASEPNPAETPDVTVSAFSSSAVTLWPAVRSNATAVYDVVVESHPAGQTCVVRMTNGAAGTTTQGSALWMRDAAATSSTTFNRDGVAVRCRNRPALANQLTGTYQLITRNTASPAAITTRNYMSFFADGTFLFGTHGTAAGGTGVEHGFYSYNPVAQTLDFTLHTDTNVSNPAVRNVTPLSLSHTLSYTGLATGNPGGGVSRATSVVKSTVGNLGQISMTFSGTPTPVTGQPAPVPTSSTWVLTEPKSAAGQMTGAWVTADSRRQWIFNFDDTTGAHIAVSGPASFADGCFVFDDSTAASGYYTRRGGSTGCMTTGAGYVGGFATLDNLGGSSLPPGTGLWRMPGTQNAGDGRPPSPSLFTIVPGSPDTLTVEGTINGEPNGHVVTFRRSIIN